MSKKLTDISMNIPDSKFNWKYSPYTQSYIISVWDFLEPRRGTWQKIREAKPEIITRNKIVPIDKLESLIEKAADKISNTEIRDQLEQSLKWLPESGKEGFGIFLRSENVSKKDLKHLKTLLHGNYGPFYVLTRGERPFKYYRQVIEFFERFDHLVLSEDAGERSPYLFHQIPADAAANSTYLLFSDTDLNGMLIKSLADPEYGGAIDREIEVILLGQFLRYDVPQHAVILKGGQDTLIDQFGDKAPVFIEALTPGSKPLNSAIDYDMYRIARENPEMLGRMLVFDAVCGAWDRHLGNYLIHDLDDGTRSIQEIDFGLFDPLWIKPGNYSGRLDEWITEKYASFNPDRAGWDITRHARVTKMIEIANRDNRERVLAGIQQSLFQLELGKKTDWFRKNLSEKFCNRIDAFLDPNSELRFGFQQDLVMLNLHD